MLTPRQTSPYNLMQERYRDNPWALLVGCILFNMVRGSKAQPVHEEFLKLWPNPYVVGADFIDPCTCVPMGLAMRTMFKPLGFQNRRTDRIIKMTLDFLELRPDLNPSVPIKKLSGCGKYASDSFEIFVRGKLVDDVLDKELKKYVEWARDLYKGSSCLTLPTSQPTPKEGTT